MPEDENPDDPKIEAISERRLTSGEVFEPPDPPMIPRGPRRGAPRLPADPPHSWRGGRAGDRLADRLTLLNVTLPGHPVRCEVEKLIRAVGELDAFPDRCAERTDAGEEQVRLAWNLSGRSLLKVEVAESSDGEPAAMLLTLAARPEKAALILDALRFILRREGRGAPESEPPGPLGRLDLEAARGPEGGEEEPGPCESAILSAADLTSEQREASLIAARHLDRLRRLPLIEQTPEGCVAFSRRGGPRFEVCDRGEVEYQSASGSMLEGISPEQAASRLAASLTEAALAASAACRRAVRQAAARARRAGPELEQALRLARACDRRGLPAPEVRWQQEGREDPRPAMRWAGGVGARLAESGRWETLTEGQSPHLHAEEEEEEAAARVEHLLRQSGRSDLPGGRFA